MILAILQARSSSRRFPRKVLAPLLGEAMILRQLERLSRSSRLDRIVVATSTDPSDDELATLLREHCVDVRRGPLDDVFSRFAEVVAEFAPEQIVRLTADCPLADSEVVDQIVGEHLAHGVDYTSNVHPPSFPDGLDVEIFTAMAFAELGELPLTAREREHVTLGFVSRPERFSSHNVAHATDHSDLRWTVDVPDDLLFVESVYRRLYDENPGFAQEDVLALLAAEPALNRTARDLARNAGLQRED